MSETIEIYWQDLTKAKQQEILQELGDNGNWDVFPICTIDIQKQEEDKENAFGGNEV